MERDKLLSLPIEPVYWQDSPNSQVSLGDFAISIDMGNEPCIHAEAQISLKFAPSSFVEIEANVREESRLKILKRCWPTDNRGPAIIEFAGLNTKIQVSFQSSVSGNVCFRPMYLPIQVRAATPSIQRSVFHLFNWPDFDSKDGFALMNASGTFVLDRFVIIAGGWKVTVHGTENTSEMVKALRFEGGYSISHVGSVERENSEGYSTEQLDEFLVVLRFFFKMVLGRESAPSLVIGCDSVGSRVYERLGMAFVDRDAWRRTDSWFVAQCGELLAGAFSGFWSLYHKDVWQRPIREALYWYCHANRATQGLGVDSALLFSQSALELLAWNYCVKDQKMVSEKAFKQGGLNAADKLRLLVSSLGIPKEIPVHFKALNSRTNNKKERWVDSMHAITDLRNGLVHPDSDRSVPDGSYYEAWRLSMWYLDLVFLKLCGYDGLYSNRISEKGYGSVERVPWAIA